MSILCIMLTLNEINMFCPYFVPLDVNHVSLVSRSMGNTTNNSFDNIKGLKMLKL